MSRASLVLFSFLFISFSSFASETGQGPTPPAESCPTPAALADAPYAQTFVTDLCTAVGNTLDYRRGAGTGELARDLRALAQRLGVEADSISLAEIQRTGFTFEVLRRFVLESTKNHGITIPVVNYKRAVEKGNERLHGAGVDFITLVQDPIAELMEGVWDFSARMPKLSLSQIDLKRLADIVYPGLGEKQIKLPLTPEAIAELQPKFDAFTLVADEEILTEADVPLPQSEKALDVHSEAYRKMSAKRLAISMLLGLGGGYVSGGGATSGIAVGVTAALLEFQFARLSRYWAKFWDRFGFKGNVAVNALYGSIITGVMTATQAIAGDAVTTDVKEFLTKTLFVGTSTFVGSFGAMQVAAARVKENGEFSEYGRFRLENYSVYWNSLGRVIALSAAGLGAQYDVGKLFSIAFNSGEVIGWGVQSAYLSVITAPFWLKLLIGDSMYNKVTQYEMLHRNDPDHPWNRGMLGAVRRNCAYVVSYAANLFTPRRQ